MPKRQKEKQYQSAREHRANQSLRSGSSSLNTLSATRPLPFECCALTLTPYGSPVCNQQGIIFDNAAITPYLMKHKKDPVTGNPMTSRDLISLHMDKDESTDQWQCPVLNKAFTNRTKIVAIRQPPSRNEANVFSYEAYHELNVKAKNNFDLVSGLKFSKDDVIVLQDPENQELVRLRDIHNFKHVNSLREEEQLKHQYAGGEVLSGNVRHSLTANRILEKLGKEKRKREKAAEDESKKLLKMGNSNRDLGADADEKKEKIYTDELLTAVNLTSGKASGSLTSTVMGITSENKAREATQDEIITSQCEALKRLKKKGTVRMFTNVGAMDIEIHADIVPRTAMNFMLLAEKGEYDGSKFHRSIRNFMIQGGKKSNKSTKSKGEESNGDSVWGKPFQDEFDDRLTHTGPGILSMANSGPGTNGRQFFITFKSAPHLNRKHSVFGKVVRGLEVLRKIEQIPTDKETDKPLHKIFIEQIEILDNPVQEALDNERKRIRKRKEEKLQSDQARTSLGSNSSLIKNTSSKAEVTKLADGTNKSQAFVVGKYLNAAKRGPSLKSEVQVKKANEMDAEFGGTIMKSRLPPPPKKTTFGDFSGW